MNEQIRETLDWRATVVHNSEKLIKFGAGNDKNQLSLFDDDSKELIRLESPSNISYDEMLQKEKEVLGVNLLYNIFDRYILIFKRFCNHTIGAVNERTESSNEIVFMGMITEIEYRKSQAGNNYAKVFFRDKDSTIRVYLWGEMYKRHIRNLYSGSVYLVEVNYNKENDSTSIVNIKKAEDLEVENYIDKIIIYMSDFNSAFQVKFYIDNKMFGSTYNLEFDYNGDRFPAPFKINFNEENYLYIKDLINDIQVVKKQIKTSI